MCIPEIKIVLSMHAVNNRTKLDDLVVDNPNANPCATKSDEIGNKPTCAFPAN